MVGSNPSAPTIKNNETKTLKVQFYLGYRMHKIKNYAPIAQMVELPAFNRKGDVTSVEGSSPSRCTKDL
jgi:hypothetical protein